MPRGRRKKERNPTSLQNTCFSLLIKTKLCGVIPCQMLFFMVFSQLVEYKDPISKINTCNKGCQSNLKIQKNSQVIHSFLYLYIHIYSHLLAWEILLKSIIIINCLKAVPTSAIQLFCHSDLEVNTLSVIVVNTRCKYQRKV